MDKEGAAGIIKMILLVQDLHAKENDKARYTANKDWLDKTIKINDPGW